MYQHGIVVLLEKRGQKTHPLRLEVKLRYSEIPMLPDSFLHTSPRTIGSLDFHVMTRDKDHDQFVDLLPILRLQQSTDPQSFRTSFYKPEVFPLDEDRFLLLRRIFSFQKSNWLAKHREPVSVDAIQIKFAAKHIDIVLKHDAIICVDVDNDSEVREFLRFLRVVDDEEMSWTLVKEMPDVTVTVTRSVALED